MTDEELNALVESLTRLGEAMRGIVPGGEPAEITAASAIRQLMKERDKARQEAEFWESEAEAWKGQVAEIG